jgi:hypothetical protein
MAKPPPYHGVVIIVTDRFQAEGRAIRLIRILSVKKREIVSLIFAVSAG